MKVNLLQPKSLIAGAILSLAASASQAAVISIEFTNLTHGIYYTPLFFAAHTSADDYFEVGTDASDEVEAMAEIGDNTTLVALADSRGNSVVNNPVGAPTNVLAPGASVSIANWDTGSANDKLTVLAMLLPTNDAFVGLDSWTIPSAAGTYTVTLNAYDAGTEINDEIFNGANTTDAPGIPGAPGGDTGTGATGLTSQESNTTVHIHRGASGDNNPTGGVSDLDATIHRWLNPVARIVVTVQ